jgi:peptide/nickel transport system substrate-binding protein
VKTSAQWRAVAALATVAALAGTAGCGGSNNKSGETTPKQSAPAANAKAGGDLTIAYAADTDNIDPGITYYQYGMNIAYATQRPLYSYKPDDAKNLEPDLAEGPPQIAADGKTVTVKIRAGVKFSPPVNRVVTTKDVKYGIERGFTKTVNGAYVGAYMGDLVGLDAFKSGKASDISGIQTPDDTTIVFKLTRPRGAIVAGCLSMPASAPVPPEYAKKFDKQQPSQYGQHQVATGPYMIENDASGKLTGFQPGQQIKLVRNPNWSAKTDYKPAYLDSITIKEGSDPDVAARQIVSGTHMVSGDFQLTASTLQRVSRANKDLLVITPPTGRYRYIALNTTKKPFDNVNVRKAIVAVFDRNAMRQAFGGPLVGEIPTHYIPPGQPGFDEAGGAAGPGYDFMAKPSGDLALAQQYMKKAGFSSGKYTGSDTFEAVTDNATQQLNVSQVAQQQFAKLGFKVKLKPVTRDAMYTKFCQVKKAEPPICPSVGWLKDFADAETLLDPVFNGKNILDVGNSNFAQLNDSKVNKLMDAAEVVNDPAKRNQAWGDVDKALTDAAPGVPWLWDKQPVLHSKDVNGVINQNLATWDFTFTSVR